MTLKSMAASIFAPRCKCCANVAFTVIATDNKSSAISVFALAQNCANVVFATHCCNLATLVNPFFRPVTVPVTYPNTLGDP